MKKILKPNQKVVAKWNNKNKKHFEEIGYAFTFNGDEFEVKVEDLMPSSKFNVIVICDYCGREVQKNFQTYVKQHDETFGDACRYCQPLKNREITRAIYGVDNVFQLEYFKQKSKETCLENYGVEKACQSNEIKEKNCTNQYVSVWFKKLFVF